MLEVWRYIAYTTLNAFNCTYKDQSNVTDATDFNALIAMYVEDVKDGVCSFYTILHTQLLILLLMLKVLKVSNTMNN